MNKIKRKLKKLKDEIWRVVPDSNERYQVSNYGRIKSFAYDKKDGQILKCSVINGFKIVQLATNKGRYKIYIHKLVAQIWTSKPSDKHIFVTHLDGNLTNNHISNLEWHTRETLTEKHRELGNRKNKNPNRKKIIRTSKLNESDIRHLKSMLEKGVTQTKIAKMFCISEMQVTRIKRGENWGHIKPLLTENRIESAAANSK